MSEKASQRASLGQDGRESGRKRPRPVSGSSGGSDVRHEPQASRAHKRVATEDQKERQRQERLAKSRATAAVSRERRRIEIGEMGARADELEQNNSYLKGLLDNRDQERQLLAMELDQLLQAQQNPTSFPENVAAPYSAGFSQMPDLAPLPKLLSEREGHLDGGGSQDIPPELWRSPFNELAPAAESLDVDAAQGNACLGEPLFESTHLRADALASAAKVSSSQPADVQLQPDCREEPTADALSGASQGTRCSGPAQMTGLRSSGHSAAALPPLAASPKQPAPEQRLLPEPQRSLGAVPGLDMPAPSWPAASHAFPDQAVRSHLMAPLGPSSDALDDGWEEDGLQRLASGFDDGQAIGRKGSASLPLHLQPQLLQDFTRRGSSSLPTFWGYPDARDTLLGRSESLPGTGVRPGPGVIVGLDGQWIRLKPQYRPLPAQRQCLGMPGQSGLPSWVPQQPEPTLCHGGIPEQTQPAPETANEGNDHRELPQWGAPPTKYDSRESDDLCFGGALESLGIPDQTGLCLQQPDLVLDSALPNKPLLAKTGTCSSVAPTQISVHLSTGGAQQGMLRVPSDEPDFLNDSPFLG